MGALVEKAENGWECPMIGKLLKMILLPKRARDRLEAHARAGGRRRAASGQPRVAAGRDQMLNEAMSIYRTQLKEYESLDEETRRQIEEDAAKMFGEEMVERKR
jgi:hypothetical protein